MTDDEFKEAWRRKLAGLTRHGRHTMRVLYSASKEERVIFKTTTKGYMSCCAQGLFAGTTWAPVTRADEVTTAQARTYYKTLRRMGFVLEDK